MSKVVQEYTDKRDAAITSATKALDSGDAVAAKASRESAEFYQKLLDEAGTVIQEPTKAVYSAPPLPQRNRAEKAGFVEIGPEEDDDEGDEDKGSPMKSDALRAAAYTLRFGSSEKAVEGILRDLYGANPADAYWSQKAFFNVYLRKGERALSPEGIKALHTIVLTPKVVRDALAQGVDSVKSMKAVMVEAIDVLGGYSVPVDFQTKIIEHLKGFTVVRNRANVGTTSRDMVEYPVATGGDDQYTTAVRVSWVDETPATLAQQNLTWGMEQIPIHTSMAETVVSRNLLEDTVWDLEAYLAKAFAEAAAIDEDNRFLTGSGAGAPQGILPGGINALGLVEKMSGSASGILWNGLVSMLFAIPSQYRSKAVWIAERATYEAISKLQNGANDYLWQPFQYTGGQMNILNIPLLGYPILEQEVMPACSSQNNYPILFGDLSCYQIFDRVGMTVERYLDSTTARGNTVMFIMRRRLGGQVLTPWCMATMKIST